MSKEQSDVLIKIKRAVLAGRYSFSDKAQMELAADGLEDIDVVEAIANAMVIHKKIRSRSPLRQQTEYLYVIQSTNLDGIFIYTKGKFVRVGDTELFYFLISAKRSVY
ncbi:MAG: hypothetical protein HYR56_22345 [Acidobacteria bacterium]|nr:hypothetical protein [Acidobacteriota bacterium]MBI3424499.1 hypothetical protein [Acidobacteriota bacterium]